MSNASDALSDYQADLSGWDDLPNPASSADETSDHLSELSDIDDEESDSTEESSTDDSKAATEESSEEKEKTAEESGEMVEFKALGKTHKIPMPTKEQLPKLLAKAYGADQRLKAAAEKESAAEAKLAEAERRAATGKNSADVERASRLLKLGHSREAMSELLKTLGEDGSKLLDSFMDEEREYAKADPAKRLLMDAERKARTNELAKLQAEEKLKEIADREEASREQLRRTEYSGYISDAFGRYDLSQWIENADVANALNQTLKDSAMNVIGREQRQREAAGKSDLTQHEIRTIVAKQAKLLHGSYSATQKKETSAAAVDAKSKVAEQKMQASVTTKASADAKIQALIKKGASPTEIAAAMFGSPKNRF